MPRLSGIVLVGALLSSSATAGPLNSFIGTWKLNVSRSESRTRIGQGGWEKIELLTDGVRIHHEWTTADGKHHQETYSCILDGDEHGMEREADAKHTKHAVRCKAIDDRTLEVTTIHDDGVLVNLHRRTVSEDEQVLRVTFFAGADTSHSPVMTAIYDRVK